MNDGTEDKRDFTTRDRWLIFAMIVGPWSALMDQMVAYSLHATACENGTKALLHGTTVAFLAVSLSGAAIAWRTWSSIEPSPAALSEQRARWVSIAAIALSLFGALVILAMEIPNFILGSCD